MNIPLNSVKAFFKLNGSIILYTYLDYIVCKLQNNFLVDFTSMVLKNYIFIDIINYRLKNVDCIQEDNRIQPVEKFYGEFHFFLLSSSLIETLTTLVCKKYFLTLEENIINDLLFFIPYSFCFEILFDLFHYITHYHGHNKYIYRYFHKLHHLHRYPVSILTFYQHPIDLIITNSVPIFLSLYILSKFHPSSFFMYKLLTAYKTFIEVSGHSGKKPNGSSFIQFFWLPKIFNIQLTTEDHYKHHTINNCNYSKRFSLWDKVFGTFYTEDKTK